ncbi:hypothetical protein CPAR01_07686 [Colletotrichum paranaense]|uniref:Uncharacterized protein n=1 Tax=Colletotrichum paranaense TaxID=1914294 RepID=A0ABQ9SI43_9PEZI|nr:uncharacterized protein CPAR01_07686 [Colletotrichum paranaense]KAK1537573.1 hypothetical protein CPAR01_07686 [Colletotrichum paranaense]
MRQEKASGANAGALAAKGTLCPDSFLRFESFQVLHRLHLEVAGAGVDPDPWVTASPLVDTRRAAGLSEESRSAAGRCNSHCAHWKQQRARDTEGRGDERLPVAAASCCVVHRPGVVPISRSQLHLTLTLTLTYTRRVIHFSLSLRDPELSHIIHFSSLVPKRAPHHRDDVIRHASPLVNIQHHPLTLPLHPDGSLSPPSLFALSPHSAHSAEQPAAVIP